MSAISSGLQTPTFKAFINIPAEKSVAGFSSEQDQKPIASSSGLKGLLVKLYNSIALAFSSTFAAHKANQGAAAHQAFIGSLKNEYGAEIGEKVTRRCGLDTALAGKQQLSGQVIQDAFKEAESLQRAAKFEQEVVQATASNFTERFQSMCQNQKINPESLTSLQRQTFDDLVHGSGVVNRDFETVDTRAPNVLLLIAVQELAIRTATLPDTAFDQHIGTAMAAVDLREATGEIDAGQATNLRDALVAVGRKMAFANGVYALGVGQFLNNVARAAPSHTGVITRDLLVLAKTQGAALSALMGVRAAQGHTKPPGVDESAMLNQLAFKTALTNLPGSTSAALEMRLVAMMTESPDSVLCRTLGVLNAIIDEQILTTNRDNAPDDELVAGAAAASSAAIDIVGYALKASGMESDAVKKTAFANRQSNIRPEDPASVLEHVNKFSRR